MTKTTLSMTKTTPSMTTKNILLKKIIHVCVSVFFISFISAQVGIGTAIPNTTSILDVESTTKGFLPPRLTTDQRDAIPSPAEGLVVYNTTLNCLEFFNGTIWVSTCMVPLGGLANCVKYQTEIVEITSPQTGRIWMDRNMGASRRANSPTDYFAYGCLFQFGRATDGHEAINWTSATSGTSLHGYTTTLSPSPNPGHNLFVSPTDRGSWRTGVDPTVWQKGTQYAPIKTTYDPCPKNYRLPSKVEMDNEISGTPGNPTYATLFSRLFVPMSGNRGYRDTQIVGGKISSFFWGGNTRNAFIAPRNEDLGITLTYGTRADLPETEYESTFNGGSVRCIKCRNSSENCN